VYVHHPFEVAAPHSSSLKDSSRVDCKWISRIGETPAEENRDGYEQLPLQIETDRPTREVAQSCRILIGNRKRKFILCAPICILPKQQNRISYKCKKSRQDNPDMLRHAHNIHSCVKRQCTTFQLPYFAPLFVTKFLNSPKRPAPKNGADGDGRNFCILDYKNAEES